MENKTDFLSLFTDQQKKRIYENFRTFENLKNEYNLISDDSIDEILISQLKHIWSLKRSDNYSYKNMDELMHDLFVKICLAPEGYKTNNGEVFASVIGIEKDNEDNYVNISVVTPSMAFIDNLYFSSDYDDERIESNNETDNYLLNNRFWMKEYKPYYYELVAHLTDEELEHFNSQISHLKTRSEYDDNNGWSFWFKAKLQEKHVQEPNDYTGILHFGGSKSFANELVITSFEPVATEFSKMLNKTYTIKIKPNKQACVNYLNSFWGNSNSFKVKILNVGQANCIYIEDINSYQHFFYDLGRPNSGFYDWNSRKYLENSDLQPNSDVQNNLDSISGYNPDCIIISHWHLDHFAAYKDLNNYGIDSVWILPKIVSKKDIKSANRLFNFLVKNNATVYYLNSTGKIYDNGVIQLLSSTSANKDDPNSRSLMLRIKDTVFSADCLYEFWPDALKNNLSDVKRLVVPHHCSKLSENLSGKQQETVIFNSFSQTPLKEAFISKGFNIYHHPNPDHLVQLRKASFDIYFTKNAIDYYEFDIT